MSNGRPPRNSYRENYYLPFEGELREREKRLADLEEIGRTYEMDLSEEVERARKERDAVLARLYLRLTPWQRVQVARHPYRPQTYDYVELMFEDFFELCGDRSFGDDRAILTGLVTLGKWRLMLVGQHKGRDVAERAECNSGCPHPEGYRKALAKMKLAERFGLPVLTFIDTKGAYPGIGAEERGQSMAIAQNLLEMAALRAPILGVVLGEGGSGGALAVGVGDRVLMLEHAYYSVISPEGCAAILWKDAGKAPEAAEALKLTAKDLLRFRVIDEIIPEPLGGAHRDPGKMAADLKAAVLRHLGELAAIPLPRLLEARYRKLRSMGVWRDERQQVTEGAAKDALLAPEELSQEGEKADLPPHAEEPLEQPNTTQTADRAIDGDPACA